MVGVDVAPLGRGDLVAVDEGRTTGLSVAEADGLLQPPVTAWGGVAGENLAGLFGFAVASVSTRTWTPDPAGGDDLVTNRRVTALRPSADLRWYPTGRSGPPVQPWLGAGLHVVAPLVSNTSDAWTKKEQAAWTDAADEDRARLFGVGGRLGGGCELRLDSGLRLGARYDLGLHRAQVVDEAVVSATTRASTAGQLSLAFDL
jgi:hypothetical protein